MKGVATLRSRGALGRFALGGLLASGAGLALALPASPSAADTLSRVTLDPAASHVEFELKATFHTVHGSFSVKEGTIDFDPQSGRARGRVVVDARSGQTGSESRDENMHRDVLESERFPEIVFLPEKLAVLDRGGDEARAELSGVVEIHGVREPLVIPAIVRREGGGIRVDATFSVPYVRWGLEDPSLFVLRVAPDVTIHLDVTGSLGEAPPAPAD